MGKFLATTYQDTVEGITSLYSNLVNNPFYDFNDKKPVLVTYYNINKDYTSLDPGSKLAYDNVGADTPMRFNQIDNMMLYGIDRIELNTQIGEFGLEGDPIQGDCYLLPNTIIPTEGDFFEMDHVKDSTWLFIVTDTQKDTLDNGANVYKISYQLQYTSNEKIKENVVKHFEHIEVREGTNIASVVECKDADTARMLTKIASRLKGYYNELFYNKYVQTFIYEYMTEFRIYDPYMIQFLINNAILDDGDDNYVYVNHVIPTSKTFRMEYDKSIFKCFELKDASKIMQYTHQGVFEHIVSYGVTFSSRYESYFKMIYSNEYEDTGMVNLLDEDIINHIQSHKLYKHQDIVNEPDPIWKNLLVKHFYKDQFEVDEVLALEQLELKFDTEFFYLIPLIIYVLEAKIQEILSK